MKANQPKKPKQDARSAGVLKNNKALNSNTNKAISGIVGETIKKSDMGIIAEPGVFVLFSGPQGTGKTMAAEILAKELGRDLYRIDLSEVVSKYIGETEKNLKRVFKKAEELNSILFFDEADAIFGKRSKVKDSHDRYANLEISYLLQLMENYGGLVVLATNNKENLDPEVVLRLKYVLEFHLPKGKTGQFSGSET